jgi:hypothetical protein
MKSSSVADHARWVCLVTYTMWITLHLFDKQSEIGLAESRARSMILIRERQSGDHRTSVCAIAAPGDDAC